MRVVQTVDDLRAARAALRGTVGVVLTMGALHEGHMALVREARQHSDAVLTTIFVNPTQFGPDEDLSSYPNTLQRDLDSFEAAGVDVVFTPLPDVMYPPGYQTYVNVEEVSAPLEGAHRPGHFQGVTTVVAKLFNLTQPTRTYFGQKDAQQVVVIRRMVRDLNFPLDVVVVPTVREPDGLAMSSRNAYLSGEERRAAAAISRALQAAVAAYEAGERNPDAIRNTVSHTLKAEPLADVNYISLANPLTLTELNDDLTSPALLSLTVQIGKPRLLDNMLLPAHLNTVQGLTAHLGTDVYPSL